MYIQYPQRAAGAQSSDFSSRQSVQALSLNIQRQDLVQVHIDLLFAGFVFLVASNALLHELRGSDGDPDQHDDHVQALALATVVLEGPHAVLLLVPVGARGAVHAPAADVRLAVGGGRLGAGRDVRLLGLGLGAAAGLVQGRRGDEVLDDGAVAGELVGGGGGALGSGLGDDGLQHRALVGGSTRRSVMESG